MRWIPYFALAALLGPVQALAAENPPSVGSPAPGFELIDVDGGAASLQAARGRVVLLNFWATWCAPCRAELPELAKLQKTHGDDLLVLAVSVDKKAANVRTFLQRAAITGIAVALDPQAEVAARYQPRAMPATYIVDRRGVLRYQHLGYSPEIIAEYGRHIELLLAETGDGQ